MDRRALESAQRASPGGSSSAIAPAGPGCAPHPPPRVPVRVTCVLARPGGGRGLLALRNKGFHGDGDEDRHRTKEPGFLRHLSMEKVP